MAGEIQLNSTTFATESGGTITVANVDSATNRQNLGLEIGVDVQAFDADTTKNDVANTFTANQIISVTDNTNAALRVTQLGTGNALVVEDETNPDSSPFVVDSSGNVLVGTTSTTPANSSSDTGVKLGGQSHFSHSNDAVIKVNRINSDGNIVEFRKDGTTTVGYIGTGNSGDLYIGNDDTGLMFAGGSNAIIPTWGATLLDNTLDLGVSNYRFDDIYASNGTIVTSDANEKENITTSDLSLDFINQLNPVSYRYIGKTRTHYGLIAQEIETLLSTLGKSTTDFAGFIKSPVTDDDGNETGEYKYGLRYNEFISPMIKAIQEQQALIESQQSQIDALTARIEALETA